MQQSQSVTNIRRNKPSAQNERSQSPISTGDYDQARQQQELEHHKNLLIGINEKLTVFNDVKQDLEKARQQLGSSEAARRSLQDQISSQAQLVSENARDNAQYQTQLINENHDLRKLVDTIEAKNAKNKDDFNSQVKKLNVEHNTRMIDQQTDHAKVRTQFSDWRDKFIADQTQREIQHTKALAEAEELQKQSDLKYRKDLDDQESLFRDNLSKVSDQATAMLKQVQVSYNNDTDKLQQTHSLTNQNAQKLLQAAQQHYGEKLRAFQTDLQKRDQSFIADLQEWNRKTEAWRITTENNNESAVKSMKDTYDKNLQQNQQSSQSHLAQKEQSHAQQMQEMQVTFRNHMQISEKNQKQLVDEIRAQNAEEVKSLQSHFDSQLSHLQTESSQNLREQDKRHAKMLQEAHDAYTQKLQDQENRHQAFMREKENQHAASVSDLVKKHAQTVQEMNAGHSAVTHQNEQKHAQAIKELQESNARRLQELEQKNAQAFKQEQEANTKRISELEDKYAQSLKSTQDTNAQRVKELEHKYQTLLSETQDANLRYIKETEARNAAFVADLKSSQERKLQSVESQHKILVDTLNKTNAKKLKDQEAILSKFVASLEEQNNKRTEECDRNYNMKIAQVQQKNAETLQEYQRLTAESLAKLREQYESSFSAQNQNYRTQIDEIQKGNAAKLEELVQSLQRLSDSYNQSLSTLQSRFGNDLQQAQADYSDAVRSLTDESKRREQCYNLNEEQARQMRAEEMAQLQSLHAQTVKELQEALQSMTQSRNKDNAANSKQLNEKSAEFCARVDTLSKDYNAQMQNLRQQYSDLQSQSDAEKQASDLATEKLRASQEAKINELDGMLKRCSSAKLHVEGNLLALQNQLKRYMDIEAQVYQMKDEVCLISQQKDELSNELNTASAYIVELEEKRYKSWMTSLELLKQLKSSEATCDEMQVEIETLRNYIIDLKSRIAVYIPVKGDQIDKRIAEYINNYPDRQKLKIMFMRESEGVYQFGSKRIAVKVDKDKINIRVGGGYLSIDEFLDQYTPAELEKLERKDPMKRFSEKVAVSKTIQGHIVRDVSPQSSPLASPKKSPRKQAI